MKLGKFLLPLALAFVSGPVMACSYPADLFEEKTRAAMVVDGVFELAGYEKVIWNLTNRGNQNPEFEFAEGQLHWSNIFRGVLTGADGKRYEITYEVQAALGGCTPFSFPDSSAEGRYYLAGKQNEDGSFELIHWQSADTTVDTSE